MKLAQVTCQRAETNKTGKFYPGRKIRSSISDSVSLVLTRTITLEGEVTYQTLLTMRNTIRSGGVLFRQSRIFCTEVMEEKISRAPLVL